MGERKSMTYLLRTINNLEDKLTDLKSDYVGMIQRLSKANKEPKIKQGNFAFVKKEQLARVIKVMSRSTTVQLCQKDIVRVRQVLRILYTIHDNPETEPFSYYNVLGTGDNN